MQPVYLFVVVLALALQCALGEWHQGRATYHGTDAWPIHKGSCGFGYLDPEVSTGWDITALADTNWDYIGSCGLCYEVRCRKMSFNDGFGQWLDRSNVCRDEGASVIVQVTDTCACYYTGNPYSNKRWCCGDMQHFDLSTWAYEKLADLKWGVIGIEYRRVDCGYKPEKQAQAPTPSGFDWHTYYRPSNWDKSMDKRPSNSYKWQNERRSSESQPAHSG